jgi:dihydroorotate dehydrogenase (fumarate)
MIDLSCKYLGLKLKNPLIVGSSGLTSSLENLKTIARQGAGAVILKSIFEEQIKFETDKFIQSDDPGIKSWQDTFQGIVNANEYYFDEAFDYLTNYAQEHTLNHYLAFVSDAKKSIDIPVIASIHCTTQYDWQYFAKRIQDAGADALELNAYVLPSDFEKNSNDIEQVYFDIIKEVKNFISIPFSLKIGYYFSSLAQTTLKLSETGIAGLTLFNRPYNPDIDIDAIEINSSNIFSSKSEYSHTLRWVALLAGKLKCDIAASTGIHDHETVIKQLLAGADAVQMVSVFYKHHFDVLPKIIGGIETWMRHHNFNSIDDFKGLLSRKNVHNPASYERVQFIRLYSSIV